MVCIELGTARKAQQDLRITGDYQLKMHLKYDAIAQTKDQCSMLILRLRAQWNWVCPRRGTETTQALGNKSKGELLCTSWQRD